jgi:hypothetical protein
MDGHVIRKALVKGDDRFWLLRDWSWPAGDQGDVRTITFVMLNPSKADHRVDDPTIRKCIGFSTRLGFKRMWAVNLFSKRATDPRELQLDVGRWLPNRVQVRRRLVDECVVFAWGASVTRAAPTDRAYALGWLAEITQRLQVEPMCLGVSKDGHPRHPLMLPYTAPLRPWKGYDVQEWAFLR